MRLSDQDRNLWHRDEIQMGLALIGALAPAEGYTESLRLQAIIAAEHARAACASQTNWAVIARAYERLEQLTGSPIVRLNRAVAVAEVHGAKAALALLEPLDALIGQHHRLAAVRAELAHRAGDVELARASYQEAIRLCENEVERRFLRGRIDALGARV